jgi:hypothetical protein
VPDTVWSARDIIKRRLTRWRLPWDRLSLALPCISTPAAETEPSGLRLRLQSVQKSAKLIAYLPSSTPQYRVEGQYRDILLFVEKAIENLVRMTREGLSRVMNLRACFLALTASTCVGAAGPTLFPVRVQGRYGYVDARGKLSIPPKFDFALPFSEERAIVRAGDRRAIINIRGNEISTPPLQDVESFREGFATFRTDHGYGYLDLNGQIAIPPQFAAADSFCEGLAAVRRDDRWGYIDKSGKWIIRPAFENAGRFAQGRAAVRRIDEDKVGYIDRSGRLAIPTQFDETLDFALAPSGVLAAVRRGARWSFIRSDGSSAWDINYDEAGAFSEGLAPVRQGGQWGYIDSAGRAVIDLASLGKIEYAWPFKEERARIRLGGKIGYVTRDGKLAVSPRFDSGSDFSGGLAEVRVAKRSGLIDPSGRLVWPLSE